MMAEEEKSGVETKVRRQRSRTSSGSKVVDEAGGEKVKMSLLIRICIRHK